MPYSPSPSHQFSVCRKYMDVFQYVEITTTWETQAFISLCVLGFAWPFTVENCIGKDSVQDSDMPMDLLPIFH